MNSPSYDIERIPCDARIKQLGNRVIFFSTEATTDLSEGIETILGADFRALDYEAGLHAGRGSVKSQLQVWPERGMEFLQKWSEFHDSRGCGWFKIEDLTLDLKKGKGFIQITQSFTVEAAGKSDKPVCHYLAGFIAGVVEEVVGHPLICEETTCTATGDSYCTFKIDPVEES